MNYGSKVEVIERVSKRYITHGINENVWVSKVEKVTGENNGVVWNAFEITFTNDEGSELVHRIYEYKFFEGRTDLKGNLMDDNAQQDRYRKRVKHIFSKVVGDKDLYDTLISKAVDFDSFIKALSDMSTKYNNKLRLMCIDNKKGYATVPDWDSGFCESMSVSPTTLKFNESKYGKKKKDETKVEKTKETDNSLDWLHK